MPVQLQIAIYNAAGERVRTLFVGRTNVVPQSLSLSQDAILTGLGSVSLNVQGAQVAGQGGLSWDGTNDNGQPVAGGTYTWHVEYKLPDDQMVSQNLSIQAMAAPSEQRVEIFNSAGERVYQALLPTGPETGGFRLDQSSMIAGADANGSALGQLKLFLQVPGGEQPWTWDGRNDQGAWVSSGTYTVQLSQAWPDGRRQTLLKSFTVLRAPDLDRPGGDLSLGPSPLRPGQALRLAFSPAPGYQVDVRLYDLAGEIVGTVGADASSGGLVLQADSLASGIYLARVRFFQDGLALARVENLKLCVVH
jgi:hypothetical protein